MKHDIHPTIAADRWGNARAISFRLDHEFQSMMPVPLGLPDLGSEGFAFHRAIGALGIVKPFDWMKWGEPHIEKDMVSFLDDEKTWKHITRIVRAERFCEGTFDANVRDGSLTALVRHLYFLRRTDNGRPLQLPMFSDGAVEPGLRLASVKGTTIGHSTGRSATCTEGECERWAIEIEDSDGDRELRCSSLWHYVEATEEMFVLPRARHRTS